MRTLLPYLKPFRKECIISPLFKLLEALLELFVPLLVAAMQDLLLFGVTVIMIAGAAVLVYELTGLPTWLGGNGYLSAYIVGLVLGNQRVVDKKELVHFMDGDESY